MSAQFHDVASVAGEWFVRRSGEVTGPFASGRIRQDLLEGEISLEDEVSHDQVHWQVVAQVTEVVPRALRVDPASEESLLRAQRRQEQRKAYLTILLAIGLFGLALAITMLLDQTVPVEEADCGSAPAPGVQWPHCQLQGLEAAGAQLQRSNLASANLAGSNLAGTDLRQASLRFSNLGNASLVQAQLQQADLTGADLRNADLSQAVLEGADLSYADLSGARLDGARFEGARLGDAIWTDGRHCAPDSIGSCQPKPTP